MVGFRHILGFVTFFAQVSRSGSFAVRNGRFFSLVSYLCPCPPPPVLVPFLPPLLSFLFARTFLTRVPHVYRLTIQGKTRSTSDLIAWVTSTTHAWKRVDDLCDRTLTIFSSNHGGSEGGRERAVHVHPTGLPVGMKRSWRSRVPWRPRFLRVVIVGP